MESGNAAVVGPNTILRTIVGSNAHGIEIEGTDDRDEMGAFVEPAEHVIGLEGPMDQYIYRSQPEGVRSGHGDVDLTVFSLRKFVRLALAGNATVLVPLFVPDSLVLDISPLGTELRSLATDFLSVHTVHRLMGYAREQKSRMLSGPNRKVPSRPELVERYGYDTKFAGHFMRLAYQALELATTGTLTLPMPPTERQTILNVRRGEIELHEVILITDALVAQVGGILHRGGSPLPAEPNRENIGRWIVSAHARHWDGATK
jgi:uncharacterized protein